MLWILYPQPKFFDYDSYKKFAPDLEKDGFYRWLDRYFLLLQLPLGVVLYFLGGWSFVFYGLVMKRRDLNLELLDRPLQRSRTQLNLLTLWFSSD